MLKRILNLSILLSIFYIGSAQDNFQVLHYSGIAGNLAINDLDIDRENQLWVSSEAGAFKVGSFNQKASNKSSGKVNSITIARNSDAWAIVDNKKLVNLNTQESIPLSEQIEASDLAYYRNKLFLGTDKGLFVFNPRTLRQIDHHTADNSKLNSNKINFVFADSKDILWVGTDSGIIRINDRKWKMYDKNQKMKAIFENIEGVWLVTDSEFWVIDQNNRWYPAGLSELCRGDVRDITIDKNGKIYIASEVLTRFDPYTEKTQMYGEELGLLSKQCLSLACDQNNQIWIGTADAGLYKIGFKDADELELTASIIVEKSLNCNGSNNAILKVSASGGKKPYKYNWENEGIRGTRPAGLAAGYYQLTIVDDNGSEYVSSISISEPDALNIEVMETERVSSNSRRDGKATIAVSGGLAPYQIIWPNGQNDVSANRLAHGKHKVRVVDSLGCISTKEVTIKKAKVIPDLNVSKLNVGQTLRINELYFEADSSFITEESKPVLEEIFQFLQENQNIAIEIGGHTNNIPSHEYCDKLSTARAKNVAEYIYDLGIDPERISYKGYGKRNPITDNRDSAARRKNQRVEIKILEIK